MHESRPPERALVTGAQGQLGLALGLGAPDATELRACARTDFDICSEEAIARHLDSFGPDVLINAAAYTAVDRAEEDRDAAFAVNATAPGLLARACAERGIRFLHVSTDFVFDGRQSRPYEPGAATQPLGVYGESKRAGEEAVLAADSSAIILRTGWVYSAGTGNFLATMLRLHAERDEITVVADQVGTPTATRNLAAALWAFAARPALSGVYHFSDAGVCSWYDFAHAIGEEAVQLELLATAAQVRPIRSEDYPTPAIRPAYSVLDKTATWADTGLEAQHWREALRQTLEEKLKERRADGNG
jgi:dTDP-4-dehydrorhamnose reductase